MWQADHTPLDLWVLDERGKPARPLLTIVIDDYSRVIPGYLIGIHAPSALWTALALRQAIWRKSDPHWTACGIPEVFYTDHGSDFTSRQLEQVAADLNMRLSFSIAGRPRGRGKVERFLGAVNQRLLSDLPGYTPAGTGTPVKPVLTLSQLDARFRTWLVDEYHQDVHSETGVAPQTRWESGGFLPRLPESLEQLDLLLINVARPRRVQRDGIHFQGFLYLDLTLAVYVGEDIAHVQCCTGFTTFTSAQPERPGFCRPTGAWREEVQRMNVLGVDVVLDAHATVGEGPVWDERTGTLVWVDIMNNSVHVYDPASGTDRAIDDGQPVGAAALRGSGGVVAGSARRFRGHGRGPWRPALGSAG
jgi:hypothetical protein